MLITKRLAQKIEIKKKIATKHGMVYGGSFYILQHIINFAGVDFREMTFFRTDLKITLKTK